MGAKTEEEIQRAAKNIHSGHRQRLREKFTRTGTLEHFEDHEILEMLLFCVLPRRNTNPIAHQLLLKFGSLDKVLEATVEELQTVSGVGPKAAAFLTALPGLARDLERASYATPPRICLKKQSSLQEFMDQRFSGNHTADLYLLLLDPEYHFLAALPFYSLRPNYITQSLRQFDLKRADRVYCVERVNSAVDPTLPLSQTFPLLSFVLDAYAFTSWDYFLSGTDGQLSHIHSSSSIAPSVLPRVASPVYPGRPVDFSAKKRAK